MRRPDFLIVGAAKSGTTSLSNYLAEHPEIEVVSNRLEFFGEYENPAFSDLTLEDYLGLFEECPEEIMAGEKSVSYLYSDEAPKEIEKISPDAKILMVLRNPVERAYSDYWHRRRRGVEPLSFSEALAKEPERIRNGARFELHYANYGLYADRVERYMQRFGQDSVKVFLFEDLTEAPAEVCREAFEFLGVDSGFTPEGFQVYNRGAQATGNPLLMLLFWMGRKPLIVSGVRSLLPEWVRSKVTDWMSTKESRAGSYPGMDPETREKLELFFRDDIERLEEILGMDLGGWLPGRGQDPRGR